MWTFYNLIEENYRRDFLPENNMCKVQTICTMTKRNTIKELFECIQAFDLCCTSDKGILSVVYVLSF